MSDRQTIGVYDERAGEYAAMLKREKPNPALTSFMELVTPGGRVLDLGCGPGTSAAVLRDGGFEVDAVDASREMVALARNRHGIEARLGYFEDDWPPGAHDGIWANFSLLHAPRERFAPLVARLAASLRRNGIFHLGMKTGEGEARDRLGRFYAYYSRGELVDVLEASGLEMVREFTGEGTGLSGETAPWIELQARKG